MEQDHVAHIAQLQSRLIAYEFMWNVLVAAAPADARARATVQADISLEMAPDVPVALAQQSFADQFGMLRAQLTAGLR